MTTVEERKRINEEKKQAQAKYRGGILNRETNPCLEEQELSMNCLYTTKKEDKDTACAIFFENYKTCKSFWHKVQMDRRTKGIKPELPPYEERIKIKEEYFNRHRST